MAQHESSTVISFDGISKYSYFVGAAVSLGVFIWQVGEYKAGIDSEIKQMRDSPQRVSAVEVRVDSLERSMKSFGETQDEIKKSIRESEEKSANRAENVTAQISGLRSLVQTILDNQPAGKKGGK